MKGLVPRESSRVVVRTHSLRACAAITIGSYVCSYAHRDMSTPAKVSAATSSVRRRATRVSTHAPVFGPEVFIICARAHTRSMVGHMRVSTHSFVFQTGVSIACVLARTLSILGHMRV